MEEKIFKQDNTLSSSGTLLSFPDCPNKCENGFYKDLYKHKLVKCKYCEEKRKDIVSNKAIVLDDKTKKNLEQVYRLPSYLNGINFEKESLIDKKVIKNMLEEDSVTKVYDELQNLINKASIGDLPDYSVLINLGRRANYINFVYPYMMRLYLSGVSMCPFLTSLDVMILKESYADNSNNELNISYKDLIDRDACLIYIEAGANLSDILTVKGLMELRAFRNRVTILLTGSWSEELIENLTTSLWMDKAKASELETFGNSETKGLASVISVSYKKSMVGEAPKQNNFSNGFGSSNEIPSSDFLKRNIRNTI